MDKQREALQNQVDIATEVFNKAQKQFPIENWPKMPEWEALERVTRALRIHSAK